MIFILLIFLTALTLEGMGTYISIIGLSKLFSSSIIVLMLMATLDLAKLVSVSFIYRYWKKVNFLLKTYMLIAVLVTMTITSTGAFSYLSGQFQQAYVGTQQNTVAIDSLTEEQARLQKRKEEIDKQISQLPADFIRARTTLQKQFGPEVTRINERLIVIDKELPELKAHTLSTKVEVGPILFIADAFKTTPEIAIKWIILTIIFVFDPLAVALLIAGNFLLALRTERKEAEALAKAEKEQVKHDNEDLKELLREATKKEPEKVSVPEEVPVVKQPLVTIDYDLKAQQVARNMVNVTGEELAETFVEIKPDNSITVNADELQNILNPKTTHVSDHVEINMDEDLGRAGAFDTVFDEHDHLSEEDIDETFGRAVALDSVLDEHDHLTDDEIHEQQGRAMAVDEKTEEEIAREIITLDELNKPMGKQVHRASLEDYANGDGTFNANWEINLANANTSHLAKAYDNDNSPPIVPAR